MGRDSHSGLFRLLDRLGLRAEFRHPLYCAYKGEELIASAGQPAKLYKALQAMYDIRLPDAVELHEIQARARDRLKGRVEREAKKQIRKRARAILKDRERAEGRYPWLKKP